MIHSSLSMSLSGKFPGNASTRRDCSTRRSQTRGALVYSRFSGLIVLQTRCPSRRSTMHASNFDKRCVTRTSRLSALVIPADSAARNNSKDRSDASERERCTIPLLYLICSGGTYATRRVNIVYQKGVCSVCRCIGY